jgi:hypothetical protein
MSITKTLTALAAAVAFALTFQLPQGAGHVALSQERVTPGYEEFTKGLEAGESTMGEEERLRLEGHLQGKSVFEEKCSVAQKSSSRKGPAERQAPPAKRKRSYFFPAGAGAALGQLFRS